MNQPINSIVDKLNQVREQLNLVAGSSGLSAYPRDYIGIIRKPRDNMGIVPGLLIYPCIHCGAIEKLLKKK
jgi:hypothetical protein